MDDLFYNLGKITNYWPFFLVLLRLGGFFQTVPIFGSAAIPQSVKIFISIIFAVFLFQFYKLPNFGVTNYSILEFFVLAVKEILLGALLGLALRVVFFGVLYAMDIASSMVGLSYASLFDPVESQNSLVLGSLVEILALLFFISLNLHHQLIQVIFQTFEVINPIQLSFQKLSYLAVTDFLSSIFLLGLGFAMPMVVSSILLNLVLGFLNRSVPQFNVFLVGTSLVVLFAFILIWLSLPIFLETFVQQWYIQMNALKVLIESLSNR